MRRVSVQNSGSAFEAVTDAFNLYSYNARNELLGSERYIGDNIGNIWYCFGLYVD